jgi:DnaJ-domain-containing protein 1
LIPVEKDYYLILGVNPNASQEEIREAYRFKVFALLSAKLMRRCAVAPKRS